MKLPQSFKAGPGRSGADHPSPVLGEYYQGQRQKEGSPREANESERQASKVYILGFLGGSRKDIVNSFLMLPTVRTS